VLGSPRELLGKRLGALGKRLGVNILGNPEKLVVLGRIWEAFGSSFGSKLGHFRKIREFWESPKKWVFGSCMGAPKTV
jgi:hypothetical protein